MMKFINRLLIKINLGSLLRNQVTQNIFIVFAISLLIKSIGFFKESVVASNYGLSEVLDTFFIAFLVPGFISNVFIGAFKNVFIPNYIAELKTGNNIRGFQATGFLITGLVSITFTIFAYLFTDFYLETIFPGHTLEYYQLIKSHFYFVMPCIILWGFSSLLRGLLNIDKEFRLSSLSGIFMPVSILICLFFFKDALGNLVLAVGTFSGSLLSLLYLIILSIKKGVIALSKPDFSNANSKLMFAQLPAKASSGFFTGLIEVTDQFFAAQLVVGSIAALNYGSKIPMFLTSLLITAMSSVLLPHFSLSTIENREKAFINLYKILKLVFIFSAVAAALGILFSDFFVELFFERNEFNSGDTATVSSIQKLLLLYTPFTICGMILVNFLTSINKNSFMAIVSFSAMVINFILDYALIENYGVYGIALCTTLVFIVRSLVLLYYTVKQKNSK